MMACKRGDSGLCLATIARRVSLCLGMLAVLVGGGRAAFAKEPILQLETGGHMSLVRSLVFTPDGRLISAGDDKTIRIWDPATGKTLGILRGQIGEGHAGKVYALAVSPDGRWLAAGGRMREGQGGSHPIRLYDLKSRKLVTQLIGHQGAVLSLDFSPDGKRLLSGGTDDMAIVWDVGRSEPVFRLTGHKGDVNAARFTRDATQVVTGSDDMTVRLWRLSDGAAVGILRGHGDKVISLAISPKNGVIASGGFDGIIQLWDGRTGAPLRRLARQDTEVLGLSFSPDGDSLLSGSGGRPYEVRIRDMATGADRSVHRGHDSLVLATAISPDGRLAATGGGSNNEIRLWNPRTGKLVRALSGAGRAIWAVGFSEDGRSVAWGGTPTTGSPYARAPLEFVLRLPRGERATGEPKPLPSDRRQEFRRAQIRHGELTLRHRAGGDFGYYANLDVLAGGSAVATIPRGEADGYSHNAYGFTPNGRTIIAGGGHGWLTAYDRQGRRVGDFVGHTGDIWALAVSPDGRLLLSGSDDQTVRLWNIATRENIATLFHARDGQWVLWTPQGYFAASPKGDEHVGWHINQGEARAARFVTAGQLKRHFYRPDIVRQALLKRSARNAVHGAEKTRFALDELFRRAPPDFTIAAPTPGAAVPRSPLPVTLRFASGPEPVEQIVVTVNGRRVRSEIASGAAGEQTLQVPLSGGANRIRIESVNAVGRSARTFDVTLQGRGELEKRGTLYLVSIGVDAYPNFPGRDLRFAGVDAREIHKRLLARAGPLHEAAAGVLLSKGGDAAPTAENIRAALSQLKRAGPRDTVVIFLAGHGINDGADYLFLPTDAALKDKRWQRKSVVDWKLLQEVLQNTQGRRVMLVDTCHSGNAFNARLVKDAADASINVFAATDAETLAQEQSKLGHGVFTHAVLQGLDGDADQVADRLVQMGELRDFVTKRVRTLTNGVQAPTFHLSGNGQSVFAQF